MLSYWRVFPIATYFYVNGFQKQQIDIAPFPEKTLLNSTPADAGRAFNERFK